MVPSSDDLRHEKLNSEETGMPTTEGVDNPRPERLLLKKPTSGTSTASDSDGIHETVDRGRAHSPRSSEDSQRTIEEVHDHQIPSSQRTLSRPRSSVRSIQPAEIRVARQDRRGLLARFCLMNEVTNAKHYARKTKWIVTIIVAVAGAAAPMGSSIVLPALVDITREFHSTATIANLSVAMYMLAMSIFPLWWSSFSETLGRRTIYVVSFFLFLVFNVLAAVSTSMAMFIVMRLLSGGAAASVQAVGAGTIADVWEVKERGRAMGLFYLGPLCGPLLSPILGGVFAQTLGWRSAQWFLAIFAVLLWIFIVFALPETLPRVKLAATEVKAEAEAEAEAANTNEKREPRPPLTRSTTAQSVKVKSRQYLIMARRAFIDPLRIVLLLQFPAVAVLIAYASVTFAALYMLNISIQQTFSAAPYNYNAILIGCLYLPNSAGYILSSLLGGPWVDRIMDREARKAGRFDATHRLTYLPEDRMQENAWLGASIYPASLLAYGWFAHYHVHVAAALVANFFFGVGSMLIFALVTTMLTEFLPRKASSGIALNNFVRNIFSCVGSVVTEPLIVAVGNGWLFTGVTVIAVVVGGGTMWSMKYLGPKWRVAMDKRLEGVMGK